MGVGFGNAQVYDPCSVSRCCTMSSRSHPARAGLFCSEAETTLFFWQETNHIFDRLSSPLTKSFKKDNRLSWQRLRKWTRSLSAEPSKNTKESEIASNVMEWSRVRRAAVSISGMSCLLCAIAYARKAASVDGKANLERTLDRTVFMIYFCAAARSSR